MYVWTPVAQMATAALISVLTPRAKAWLDSLAQCGDHAREIAVDLVARGCTSVEVIREEDAATLLKMPRIACLTPGAKTALTDGLTRLKVTAQTADLCHSLLCAVLDQVQSFVLTAS